MQEPLFDPVETAFQLEAQCDRGEGRVAMVLHPFHRLGAGAVALEQDTPDRGEQRGLAELIRTAEHVEPVGQT